MRYNIKHIILPLMIGVVCATSCTSDPDPGISATETGEEIKIEVQGESLARATTITTTSNLTKQPFMLFGDVSRNGEFHSGLRTLFDNTKVTYAYDKDQKVYRWDYGVKQYWHMGQEHSFVAIHPFDIKGISDIKYEASKVSFTYAMPEQAVTEQESDIKDIIVATHRRKYYLDNDNDKPIQFKFQHLLARIRVEAALCQEEHMYPADDESKKDIEFGYDLIKNEFIQIRGVELIGFYTTANVTVTPASLSEGQTQTDGIDVKINVDNNSAKAKISVGIDEDKSPHIYNNDGKYAAIIDDTDAIMMIPQTFEDGAQIKLEYTVNTDNTERDKLRSVIVPLKDKKLETGKRYTIKYKITDVYDGQIKDGSIKWELSHDIQDSAAGQSWISDTGTLSQGFGGDDQNNSENNNDNEDEG